MNHECPCQSGKLFSDCCQSLLTSNKLANKKPTRKYQAATAEALMRSRYTAYTLADWKYVFKTWHKSTRPSMPELRSNGSVEWLGLKVVRCESGLSGDTSGVVEFVATYREHENSPPRQMRETSRFVFEDSQWFYLHGDG